jgi:hypothetical protein
LGSSIWLAFDQHRELDTIPVSALLKDSKKPFPLLPKV